MGVIGIPPVFFADIEVKENESQTKCEPEDIQNIYCVCLYRRVALLRKISTVINVQVEFEEVHFFGICALQQ